MEKTMNYREYTLSMREFMKCILKAVGVGAVIAYLFYNSAFGLVLVPMLLVIFCRNQRKVGKECIQSKLAKEFMDALRTVSASLLAGYSMENAWKEAQKELAHLYGEESILEKELSEINHAVEMNIPLEQKIEELANRTGNADIASFSEVFSFAKRSGGNFLTIIEGCANHMRARYETEREIQVLLASKKFEQKIMNFMPILILAYLRISSMGFLDKLYGNMAGVLFMSVCLLAYEASILLAEHILRIEL